MNVTQHKPPGRRADLSLFGGKVTDETTTSSPRVRNSVGGEIRKREAEADLGHGCVDWYQYRSMATTTVN